MPRMILILEDSAERLEAIQDAIANLGDEFDSRFWNDAPSMIAALPQVLPDAALISLDWHLGSTRTGERGPGTGHDVVRQLCLRAASCPVIIHSSARGEAVVMQQNLQAAGWRTVMVPLARREWVWRDWLPTVDRLLETQGQQ